MLNPFRQRCLALKLETVEGTDSVPTAAANIIRLNDFASDVTATEQTRNEDRTTFGGRQHTLSNFVGSFSGRVDLIGAIAAGTAGPLADLLRTCGHGQVLDAVGLSAEYNPVSAGFPSASARGWHAGDLQKVVGGRGMFEELNFSIGGYAFAATRFQGSALPEEEGALPALDFDDYLEPLTISTESAVMSVNGFDVDGRSLVLRPSVDMATIEHTEARVTKHRDRLTQGTLVFFKSAFADLNPFALARSHAIVPLSFQVSAAGSAASVKIEIPRAQFKVPRRVEVEGYTAYEVPFSALPVTGDDEYLLSLLEGS